MNESHENFREQLLGAERLNPAYQEKYERAVQQMLEQKLSVARKLGAVVAIAICLGSALLCGVFALATQQPLARIGLVIGSVFGLACAVIVGWIIVKGTLNLRTHLTLFANMTWGAAFVMMLLAIVLGAKLSDPIKGVQVVVNVLPALIMAGVFIIFNRVDQAELKTREKLLEIEYRIAEIAEGMSKGEES